MRRVARCRAWRIAPVLAECVRCGARSACAGAWGAKSDGRIPPGAALCFRARTGHASQRFFDGGAAGAAGHAAHRQLRGAEARAAARGVASARATNQNWGRNTSLFARKQPMPRTQRARTQRAGHAARRPHRGAQAGRALSVRRRATAAEAVPRGANASAAASSASSIASSGSRSTDAPVPPRAAGGAPMATKRAAANEAPRMCHDSAARRVRGRAAAPRTRLRPARARERGGHCALYRHSVGRRLRRRG